MSKIAVVVVHYKNKGDTWECLNSLFKKKQNSGSELILIVNTYINSEEDLINKVKSEFRKAIIIENKKNLGFVVANNQGIREALRIGCKFIILLNNDTVVKDDLVNKLVTFAQSDPNIGLVSPKIYFAKGFEYHKDRYSEFERGKVIWYAGGLIDWDNVYAFHRGVDEVDNGQYDSIRETDFVTGCCMLIGREVIEKIGLFDEKYFMYYEDIDYAVRAKKMGIKVIYYPDAFIWHKNAASSDRPGSPLHIYYQNRNRLYFGFRYASLNTKKSLLIDSLRLLFKGSFYRQAVLDYYLGKMKRGNL